MIDENETAVKREWKEGDQFIWKGESNEFITHGRAYVIQKIILSPLHPKIHYYVRFLNNIGRNSDLFMSEFQSMQMDRPAPDGYSLETGHPIKEEKPDTRTADQKLADDIQRQQTDIERGISLAVDAILALSKHDKRLSNEAAAHCKAEIDIVLKIINQRRADRVQTGLAVRHFQPMMGDF